MTREDSRGVAAMLLAMALFVLTNATMKLAAEAPPPRRALLLFNETSPETSRHDVFHCPDASAKPWP